MRASFSESSKVIEKVLGYSFRDPSLLEEALTHRSVAVGRRSYEVLEFLGDALINLFVVDLLLQNFPQSREGQLAIMKAFFVSEDFLSQLSQELGLESLIKMERRRKNISSSILADVFEALWGAIYMDTGRDLNTTRDLFFKNYGERILQVVKEGSYRKDYKTLLQELTQHLWKTRPTYRLIGTEGPHHNRIFEVECQVGSYRAVGKGKSKKEAEQESDQKTLRTYPIL